MIWLRLYLSVPQCWPLDIREGTGARGGLQPNLDLGDTPTTVFTGEPTTISPIQVRRGTFYYLVLHSSFPGRPSPSSTRWLGGEATVS